MPSLIYCLPTERSYEQSGNWGHLDHNNHKAIEFKISVDNSKVPAKLQPWTWGEQASGCSGTRSKVLGDFSAGAGIHQCWLLLKHHLLRAQDQAIPERHKSNRWGRRPTSLAEQGCPLEYKVKKEGVFPMEAGSGDMGRIQRCCLLLQYFLERESTWDANLNGQSCRKPGFANSIIQETICLKMTGLEVTA